MTIIKTISISPEFDALSRDYKISWTEAARTGMSIMLADLGLKDYDNNLNLYRKMRLFQQELEKMSIEFNALKDKQQTNNDIKDVFNG